MDGFQAELVARIEALLAGAEREEADRSAAGDYAGAHRKLGESIGYLAVLQVIQDLGGQP